MFLIKVCLHIACHWYLSPPEYLHLPHDTATLTISVLVGDAFLDDLDISQDLRLSKIYKLLKKEQNRDVNAYLGSRQANEVAFYRLEPPLEIRCLQFIDNTFLVKNVSDVLVGQNKVPLSPGQPANELFSLKPDDRFVSLYIENLPGKFSPYYTNMRS